MSERNHPRRPASLHEKDAELIWGDSDPALTSEAAHGTAKAVLAGRRGSSGSESEATALAGRVGEIVDAEGLDEIAALWSRSPASTLPGALWRLYLVRAWLQRDPETIAIRFRDGAATAEQADAEPPAAVDALLAKLFAGTEESGVASALDRVAVFLRVLAAGAQNESGWVTHDDETARPVTGRHSALTATADELSEAAALARTDRLD